MAWDTDLLDDQKAAASHTGSPARLLAGPGTGKTLTLTRRICFLVDELQVEPSEIQALTFTRAAARELRMRVEAELGADRLPRIATLHAFALRQLLRNAPRIDALPKPLRIADDWEERHIILEDLKAMLGLARVDDARDLLSKLSADWQSLDIDQAEWERRFPDPAFLGAWRQHRQLYGYTLRAELVYQLKRALEQHTDFEIDSPLRHLLVDEYQDLNRCDLRVVQEMGTRGVEVYVAGDDDQSIYGFREASPEGIRRFLTDYPGARDMVLEICKRCDPEILDLGLFVARLDHARIEKPIRAEEGRDRGRVALLRFPGQNAEATGIASLCRYLIDEKGLEPDEILLLLRTDRNGAFSGVLRETLSAEGIPVRSSTTDDDPLESGSGRETLALLRLLADSEDSLAWRTLLELRANSVGSVGVGVLHDLGIRNEIPFSRALRLVAADPVLAPRHGRRVQQEVLAIDTILEKIAAARDADGLEGPERLLATVTDVTNELIRDPQVRDKVRDALRERADLAACEDVGSLLKSIELSSENLEQDTEMGKVNILTMHKAKGLTAKAVIVVAAEDEYIPGRAEPGMVGDERRLLYVSLTRAKHFLFITYSEWRTGQQQHTGRTSGTTARNLTRFLRDAPIGPTDGPAYVRALA